MKVEDFSKVSNGKFVFCCSQKPGTFAFGSKNFGFIYKITNKLKIKNTGIKKYKPAPNVRSA